MADDAGLGEALSGELTTLAICWRVVRGDGVALGFTTHDGSLRIGGMVYANAPGIAPSAIVSSDAIEVDTMDIAGALSADAITAVDLALGRYDGAEVEVFMVDWQHPDGGRQVLARGWLGTVEAGSGPDAGFTASLRGPTAMLSATRVESYSPECRAELGDWRCRVGMRGRSRRAFVAASDGEGAQVVGVDAAAAALFGDARLRVLSGPTAGLERRIVAVVGDGLRFDEPMAVAAGEAVELFEGCDKRFATCTARFGNGGNFRGEPHVPGGDVLTRFGGF
ncbi:phage protein [Polymorphobacter glacialis]|uniref:Phage protein n=1 Tax=Sandarakinorhabdus glacialis TaxID=1614636 RepID=A0A916ZHT4_9SPHN|nr:DUF2163 domain-containing protein [Polymorphobacter glacialis]GGD98805.1 phage protein [Polymorphobacter glacialis]